MARIRIIDRDLIVLTLLNTFYNMPKFATDEEITEWLRKEAARPKEEKIAEAHKAYEEARRELEQCDEQPNKIH
jgi:alpha-N-acetylglucosamine transferase